jgi:hypothetical protein
MCYRFESWRHSSTRADSMYRTSWCCTAPLQPNTDSLAMQFDFAWTKFPVSNSPQIEITIIVMEGELVLATGPNCRVSSGSGTTRNRTVATVLTSRKTRTVGNGPVLQPKTRHFKFTIVAPIKYFSSDRITTWSICRLCSFSRSITSRFQIFDRTSIHWVAIENLPIPSEIWHYFTTTQRISVGLQVWMQEVKERLKMNNLHIDHVMIRSKLKYLIGAKAVGTEYFEPQSGSNPAKNPWF